MHSKRFPFLPKQPAETVFRRLMISVLCFPQKNNLSLAEIRFVGQKLVRGLFRCVFSGQQGARRLTLFARAERSEVILFFLSRRRASALRLRLTLQTFSGGAAGGVFSCGFARFSGFGGVLLSGRVCFRFYNSWLLLHASVRGFGSMRPLDRLSFRLGGFLFRRLCGSGFCSSRLRQTGRGILTPLSLLCLCRGFRLCLLLLHIGRRCLLRLTRMLLPLRAFTPLFLAVLWLLRTLRARRRLLGRRQSEHLHRVGMILHNRNRLADQRFNVFQIRLFIDIAERNRRPVESRTAGTANAVHICFGTLGRS